jgi:hypothetical protein
MRAKERAQSFPRFVFFFIDILFLRGKKKSKRLHVHQVLGLELFKKDEPQHTFFFLSPPLSFSSGSGPISLSIFDNRPLLL